MKKLKKLLFLPLAIAVGLSLFGCDPSGSSSSSSPYESSGNASTAKYEAGTIIKNKVVNISGTDVYYEYLKFTSETEGEYSVYKFANDTYTKLDYSPVVGTSALPTAFSYDSSSGKFSATVNAVTTSSYLLESSSGNEKLSYIASELLTSEDTSNTLFKTWSSALDNISFTFENTGYAYIQSADSSDSVFFTNDAGFILVDYQIPFLWTSVNGNKNLYYKAYVTERSAVDEVGRSLDSLNKSLEFTSVGFILLK